MYPVFVPSFDPILPSHFHPSMMDWMRSSLGTFSDVICKVESLNTPTEFS